MLSADALWRALEGVSERVPNSVQMELFARLRALHEHFTIWVLRNMRVYSEAGIAPDLDSTTTRVAPLMRGLLDNLPELLPPKERESLFAECQRLETAGVPADLARQCATLPALSPALDWLRVADSQGADLFATAACYSRLAEALDGATLRAAIVALDTDGPWQERFRAGLLSDYDLQLRALVAQLLSAHGAQPEAVADFLAAREPAPQRLSEVIEALQHGSSSPSTAMLAVAVQELKGLVQAGDARRLER
jgi:glutamate dehydrogenase